MEGHDHQSCFGACGVSRALHRLSGLTSSPDWLIALSADVTIGPIRFVYLCFVQFYAAVVVNHSTSRKVTISLSLQHYLGLFNKANCSPTSESSNFVNRNISSG